MSFGEEDNLARLAQPTGQGTEGCVRSDVLIVGAGSAGSALAMQCARAGLSVQVIERSEADDAGAQWVNAVPGWAYDEARLARPAAPELRGQVRRFHMVAGHGPETLVIEPREVFEIDMRLLIQRLRHEAATAGARFAFGVRARELDAAGGLVTDAGTFYAPLVVDASGLRASIFRPGSKPRPADLCAAAQGIYQVTDGDAARRFFERYGAAWHDTVCLAGVAGGFSVIVVRADGDDAVSILAGSRPVRGYPSGARLIADFAAREGWVGERIFGGQAPIPLASSGGPSRRQVGAVTLLRFGDAAAHIFATHGSGVALHLAGSAIFGQEIARLGPGAAAAVAIERQWRRRFGLLLGASGAFRRLSQHLRTGDVAWMIRRGVMRPPFVKMGLEQRFPWA